MLLKNRRGGGWAIAGSLALLIFVIGISFNKKTLELFLFDSLEQIAAQDWGYSSLKGLLGEPTIEGLGETKLEIAANAFSKLFVKVVPRIPEIVSSKAEGFKGRPNLERIDIDIKFEEYEKLLRDRDRAIKNQILTDPQEVKAKLRYKGSQIGAKVRLKGDLSDHWRSPIRMSLRVELKGNQAIKSFKRFSLHSPGSRQYPYDQIFQKLMQKAGNLSSSHDYVRVFVNGINWGVMNIEEHMSKELLEKQEVKESIIFKFGDEKKWFYNTVAEEPYSDYLLSDPKYYIRIYQQKKYLENNLARRQFSYISEKYLQGELLQIIDIESYVHAALVASIWNSFHSLDNINTRHYLNPFNLKLKPITTDQGPFYPINTFENPLEKSEGFFRTALLSSEGNILLKEHKYENLLNKEEIEETISYFTGFFPTDFPIDYEVLYKNIEIFSKQGTSLGILEDIGRFEYPNTQVFPTKQQVEDIQHHVYIRHYDDGRIAIYNLLPQSVQLEAIYFKENKLNISIKEIPSSRVNEGKVVIDTGIEGIQDNSFEIETNYRGQTRVGRNGFTHIRDTFNPLTKLSRAENISFLEEGSNGYLIKQGNWKVLKPIVLEGNLTIEPGTQLSFDTNAYLIIKGDLIAKGTNENQIIFKPLLETWKGLYVYEGRRKSYLEHVVIEKASELSDGLLELTGSTTFYKSPVSIKNVFFRSNKSEDALNLVHSNFSLSNVVVADALSDGIDSDFSDGKIEFSKFVNINGDAVDSSGSKIEINNIVVDNVRDKAVSVGEGSILNLRESFFSSVGVGVVSKDGSVVHVDDVEIKNFKLFQSMAYMKKSFYGPPKLFFNHSEAPEKKYHLRQAGTELWVNGNLIKAKKVDVEELYKTEVMSK